MTVVSIVMYFKATAILNLAWLVISAIIAVMLNMQFIKDLFLIIFAKSKKRKTLNEGSR